VPVLDLIAAPALDAWELLGLELNLLDAQGERAAPPTLILHATTGRRVSIGRYHLYRGSEKRGGVGVLRRLTGGRAAGAGDGWFGLALTLPTRDALLRDERAPLRPEQVMNRGVRGLLAGMKRLGLDCFYPGRDAITLNGREIAMCTFETDSSGAVLFEVSLAVARGMEDLVADLECVDPDGLITCPMYGPDRATTVKRELRHDVDFDRLVEAVAAGYESVHGEVRCRDIDSTLRDGAHRRGRELQKSGWLSSVAPDPTMTMTNRIASQLGAAEIRIALAADGTVDRAMLTGDFIANSGGVARFERELRGRKLDLPSVGRAVTQVFASRDDFILGVGELTNLARLVAGAA
jgi:lipoate-protein ligase A